MASYTCCNRPKLGHGAEMNWWDERARRLQQRTRLDELKISQEYTEDEARRAGVHTREDLILVVSYLSSANQLLASIRFILIVLILAVTVIGLKVAHYW